jgi:hypothetical protein
MAFLKGNKFVNMKRGDKYGDQSVNGRIVPYPTVILTNFGSRDCNVVMDHG